MTVQQKLEIIHCTVKSIVGVDIKDKSRKPDYILGRRIYTDITTNYTNGTLTLIGSIINRDHSTIHTTKEKLKNPHYVTDKYTIIYRDCLSRIKAIDSNILFGVSKKELIVEESTFNRYEKLLKEKNSRINKLERRLENITREVAELRGMRDLIKPANKK